MSAIDWNEWGEGICMSHHKSCIAGVITLRWSLHRIYASSPIFSHSIRFVFVAHFFVNQNFGLYTIRFKPTALFCQSTNEHWWSELKIHKHTHNNEQIYGTTVHFRHSHWNRFADMALELWSTSPPMCYIIRFICKLNAAPYLCFSVCPVSMSRASVELHLRSQIVSFIMAIMIAKVAVNKPYLLQSRRATLVVCAYCNFHWERLTKASMKCNLLSLKIDC